MDDIGGGRGGIKKAGYRVLTASSGKDAIDLFKDSWKEINFVILDFILPDMPSSEIFDRLKGIDPNVKVLISSGYSVESRIKDLWIRDVCDLFRSTLHLHILQKMCIR